MTTDESGRPIRFQQETVAALLGRQPEMQQFLFEHLPETSPQKHKSLALQTVDALLARYFLSQHCDQSFSAFISDSGTSRHFLDLQDSDLLHLLHIESTGSDYLYASLQPSTSPAEDELHHVDSTSTSRSLILELVNFIAEIGNDGYLTHHCVDCFHRKSLGDKLQAIESENKKSAMEKQRIWREGNTKRHLDSMAKYKQEVQERIQKEIRREVVANKKTIVSEIRQKAEDSLSKAREKLLQKQLEIDRKMTHLKELETQSRDVKVASQSTASSDVLSEEESSCSCTHESSSTHSPTHFTHEQKTYRIQKMKSSLSQHQNTICKVEDEIRDSIVSIDVLRDDLKSTFEELHRVLDQKVVTRGDDSMGPDLLPREMRPEPLTNHTIDPQINKLLRSLERKVSTLDNTAIMTRHPLDSLSQDIVAKPQQTSTRDSGEKKTQPAERVKSEFQQCPRDRTEETSKSRLKSPRTKESKKKKRKRNFRSSYGDSFLDDAKAPEHDPELKRIIKRGYFRTRSQYLLEQKRKEQDNENAIVTPPITTPVLPTSQNTSSHFMSFTPESFHTPSITSGSSIPSTPLSTDGSLSSTSTASLPLSLVFRVPSPPRIKFAVPRSSSTLTASSSLSSLPSLSSPPAIAPISSSLSCTSSPSPSAQLGSTFLSGTSHSSAKPLLSTEKQSFSALQSIQVPKPPQLRLIRTTLLSRSHSTSALPSHASLTSTTTNSLSPFHVGPSTQDQQPPHTTTGPSDTRPSLSPSIALDGPSEQPLMPKTASAPDAPQSLQATSPSSPQAVASLRSRQELSRKLEEQFSRAKREFDPESSEERASPSLFPSKLRGNRSSSAVSRSLQENYASVDTLESQQEKEDDSGDFDIHSAQSKELYMPIFEQTTDHEKESLGDIRPITDDDSRMT